MRTPASCGMTLVEVMSCLLLLSFGILSVLGLVVYGNSLAEQAQSDATAMATATTVLYDGNPPTMTYRSELPLGPADNKTVTGYLNGYFIRRTEAAPEPLSSSATGLAMTSRTVTVELYLGVQGTPVMTYRQRLLEHQP